MVEIDPSTGRTQKANDQISRNPAVETTLNPCQAGGRPGPAAEIRSASRLLIVESV
jgi:hypothetical protein